MIVFLIITTFLFGFWAVYLSYILDNKKRLAEDEKDLNLFTIHELRSPLSSIKAASSLLLSPPKTLDQDKQESLLQVINTQALQLLEYVSILLDGARMQSKNFVPKKNLNDLKALITNRITALHPLAIEKQINLCSTIDTPIPLFMFDKDNISHVIDNLIYNAVKFTPSQGKISVSATLENQVVTVNISDTGEGMTIEQQNQLFLKFSRAGRTVGHSSGLGLYFVKQIVESHKGNVFVKSVPHEGTVIGFTLPFIPEDKN